MAQSPNRLLVLDDERGICEFVGEVAEDLGFEVCLTTRADEFRRRLGSFEPTVVVLDLQMPDADGVEQLRFLGESGCEAQVLLISGMDQRVLATAEHLGRSMGVAMLGTLPKPLMLEELEAMLEKAALTQRMITAPDLERALAEDEITVHFQPKARRVAKGWTVDGVEALARWKHPKLGLVLPDEFIPLAESDGLIAELTDRVFRIALEACAEWSAAGDPLAMAVNFSPALLSDRGFPDRLNAMIQEVSLDPALLTVEITESGAMTEPATTMDILTRLRVKNFGLAVDDFGTGFSSLKQLYRMPFNELKIDASFVRDIERDEEARTIVESVVYLAHKLGMIACAEGVETEEALAILEQIGCDRVQGYYISPPLARERVIAAVRSWNGQTVRLPKLAWSRDDT